MLRKDAATVGFGRKGKYIIAWYCSDPAPELSSLVEGAAFEKDEDCMDTDANKCINTSALEAVNKYRVQHRAPQFPALDVA
jgi:hypothetical protein